MNFYQSLLVIVFTLFALASTLIGIYQILKKKNNFGTTPWLLPLGIYVWGDSLILGTFWFLVSNFCLLTQNWYLFLLFISSFWFIRSLGETIYWLNQQFSSRNRNPPEKLLGYKIFQDESIWFVYQTFHQCLTVVALITTIYLVNKIF